MQELMNQLPTIFISGAKKCGTKTLMRFFGHHPQIIRAFMEAPYRITGDDKKDMENYLSHLWIMWKSKGSFLDNPKKIRKLRAANKDFFFMAKTGNAGIRKILDFIEKFPHFIDAEYVQDWKSKVKNIFIVCDPVHRLLSDFKHVTSVWSEKDNAINRKFLGPESSAYPFQKLTFDRMVEKFLPKMEDGILFSENQEIAEMFSTGFYEQPGKFFIGEERIFENDNGIVLDGEKVDIFLLG